MQLAAITLLDPARAAQEKVSICDDSPAIPLFLLFIKQKIALQRHFKAKRDHVLARLHELRLDVDIPPSSTFYIWLNLEKLPAPLNNGLVRP